MPFKYSDAFQVLPLIQSLVLPVRRYLNESANKHVASTVFFRFFNCAETALYHSNLRQPIIFWWYV
eukprot:m.245180 g.245180  ORF g.245180 m.245180 type:complete len:66 (+) comp15360_c4_seq3:3079-3276(+)